MDKKYLKTAKDMLAFVDASPSCYHAVRNVEDMLVAAGFTELLEEKCWELKCGQDYYVKRKDSSLIAFRIPQQEYSTIYIAAAHSDSPSFKIKTKPTMVAEQHYTRVNTEKYGGMIMSTWMDRPLSVAGRVVVEENGSFVSKLVHMDQDLLLIPSVAIHMNREVNNGMKYDAQVDTIPLVGDETCTDAWDTMVAEAAGVDKEQVLGSDLFLYVREKGKIWGAGQEFVSARALDDLQCVYGCLQGFLQAKEQTGVKKAGAASKQKAAEKQQEGKLSVLAIFDNEEVGSLTGQGADSTFLSDVLGRINEGLGFSETHLKQAIAAGYMVSADNAHAVHPNHPEYADPTNRPFLNGGIVIKYNAAQKYTTDALSEAMLRKVCKEAKVPVQTYTNKSNVAGGSTLGNLSGRHVSIRTVDIGLPQLAMHSAYETAGVRDTEYLIEAMRAFFC